MAMKINRFFLCPFVRLDNSGGIKILVWFAETGELVAGEKLSSQAQLLGMFIDGTAVTKRHFL